jgi:hypothetical protein
MQHFNLYSSGAKSATDRGKGAAAAARAALVACAVGAAGIAVLPGLFCCVCCASLTAGIGGDARPGCEHCRA